MSAAEGFQYFAGYKDMRLVPCPVQAAIHQEKDVLYHSNTNTYDAISSIAQHSADGQFHAFHMTLAASEPLNVEGIKKLEQAIGDPKKLTVHICVPDFNFENFTLEPGNPKTGGVSCELLVISIPLSSTLL